jgi:hypothetical protein
MSLLMEDLRNRRTVRVAVGYLLTAAGVFAALAVVESLVGLPDWTVRMVAGTAFVMLPFVLVLTWALSNHGPENIKPVRRRAS